MTLCETLQKATSEEDVKAAYIKALGLKNVQRNLIDIQTKEIWFEAKVGLIARTDPDHPNSPRQKYALTKAGSERIRRVAPL